jgi:hypothetical protein
VKRVIVIIGLALALAAAVVPAEAAGGPDWEMRCQNGKYAKVWLTPIRVENKCGEHSKQWVEMVFHDTDEDTSILNVAAGAKYKAAWNNPDFKVYARLGRGTFCAEDADKNYADLSSVKTVYLKGSTWRAECNPDDDRNYFVVAPRV